MTTDFTVHSVIMGAEMLGALLLLAAMIYFAMAAARRRRGWWPYVLGWSAASNTLLAGTFIAAEVVMFLLMARTPSALTPPVAVDFETWHLLAGILTLVTGALTLVTGLSLIVGGWREGLVKRGRRK